jgi:hypothetical protein
MSSSGAAAQLVAPPSAPDVDHASYHVPAFSNELVKVLNVFIPPHRESGYHRVEFFWQEANRTRAVRNVGSTRIELVEIELK